MLTSVDPRAPTALLTSLTEPFSACFLVSSTVLRDLGDVLQLCSRAKGRGR